MFQMPRKEIKYRNLKGKDNLKSRKLLAEEVEAEAEGVVEEGGAEENPKEKLEMIPLLWKEEQMFQKMRKEIKYQNLTREKNLKSRKLLEEEVEAEGVVEEEGVEEEEARAVEVEHWEKLELGSKKAALLQKLRKANSFHNLVEKKLKPCGQLMEENEKGEGVEEGDEEEARAVEVELKEKLEIRLSILNKVTMVQKLITAKSPTEKAMKPLRQQVGEEEGEGEDVEEEGE